jgi:Na+/phosphate symporter
MNTNKKIKQLEKEITILKKQLLLFAKWTKETNTNINEYSQIENIVEYKINDKIINIGDELQEILTMNEQQLDNEF